MNSVGIILAGVLILSGIVFLVGASALSVWRYERDVAMRKVVRPVSSLPWCAPSTALITSPLIGGYMRMYTWYTGNIVSGESYAWLVLTLSLGPVVYVVCEEVFRSLVNYFGADVPVVLLNVK